MSTTCDTLVTQFTPLIKSQKCAEWFLLRRFLLKEITAAGVLKIDPFFRQLLQLSPCAYPPQATSE